MTSNFRTAVAIAALMIAGPAMAEELSTLSDAPAIDLRLEVCNEVDAGPMRIAGSAKVASIEGVWPVQCQVPGFEEAE